MSVFLAKGTNIHGYTVGDYIAGGGEGSVYKATAPSGRLVALKQNNIAPDDKESYERVMRQKTLIGRRHSAVAEILDIFIHDGVLYIAMEFCSGDMLRKCLERDKRISLAQFKVLMPQCLEGLHWLHSLGIIHRDIKPENIVVASLTDSGAEVKIVDLGIALHIGKGRLTVRGMVGTLYYAAPESFLGKEITPDARTDLYSIGVMAFEALTGTHPYATDDESALMEAICSETRPLASSVVKGIPSGLDTWLKKMMALRPDARFINAKQALDNLKASMSEPVPTPKPTPKHSVRDPTPIPKFSLTAPTPIPEYSVIDPTTIPGCSIPLPRPIPKHRAPALRPVPIPKAPAPRPIPKPFVLDVMPIVPAPPVSKKMEPSLFLSVLDGPSRGKDILIPREGITLGRAELNPEDKLISCVHFRAYIAEKALKVNDLGSINGLLIGTDRKRKAILADGECITVGVTALQYRKDRSI